MYGFIAPTEITDEYPVIDPLYGIDGLRNVNLLSDLNTIPTPRRRPGMIVGVSGGTQYYKLNLPHWNNTISDWSIFNSGGGSFTGGTVTGNTIFTNGLTANTLTVNGILITGDTYATGGTYSNGTLDFYNNTGGSYQVTGLYTGQTSYVNSLTTGVGLSADTTTGDITIINTDPDQIVSISGGTGILTGGTYPNFTIENSLPDQTVVLNNGSNISVTGTYPNFTVDVTGLTDNDKYVTGFTYQDNTFTISDNSGSTFTATINTVTGLTVNGILSATTISGGTLYGDGSNLTGLSSGLNVGVTQITSGNDGRVLFQSGTTLQQNSNFFWDNTNSRLSIGQGSSPGARLDVRAQGVLSTDIAFRVRNSADTTNIISIHGDGRFLIGQNATNTCTGGFPQYAIAIGHSAVVNGQSENYSSPIAIGYDAQSVGLSSIAIGNSTRPNTGIAIGHSVQSRAESVAIGGSTTNARGTVVGSGASNSGYGGSAIGYDVDNTGDGSFLIGYFQTNSLASSFVFGNNGIKFIVNSNSNVVLANNKPITEANKATYFDASATNTITISTGTTPSTNIIDSSQIYVTDRGGTAGRASLHVRSEDGTINVLGDRTGINTSTPQARLHVANADTTLTTGLFSGTGQNILTVVGSGNTTSSPIFTVQGSSGELFSVSDSLVGSLFSVNDISGLPILEVFSDNTTLMGSYLAPSLNTTARVIATTGTTNVYSIPTSAYTGAFFDYTVSDGTNLRAGNIMSIWSGSSVNITETQTTDFGNTSGLTFNMVVSSGNAILRTSGTTGNWTVKTIVRSI